MSPHEKTPEMNLGEAFAIRGVVADRVSSTGDGLGPAKSRMIAERLIEAGYIDIPAVLSLVRADDDDLEGLLP